MKLAGLRSVMISKFIAIEYGDSIRTNSVPTAMHGKFQYLASRIECEELTHLSGGANRRSAFGTENKDSGRSEDDAAGKEHCVDASRGKWANY